jgi:hypothetical protein
MKKTIIGLAGRKQSGKTTVANHLVEAGFVRVSFADSMRYMIRSLLISCGFSAGHVEMMLMSEKETVIDSIGKSPRQLMQLLGTDWGRHLIHEDIWVMAAKQKVNSLDCFNIVFDDVRFENEAAMIRSLGGLIIHIDRDSDSMDGHVSEAGIERHDADYLIVNNGALDHFLQDVERAVSGNFGV